MPIRTAEQKQVATDSGRFSQKEDTSSLAASYSPYATAAPPKAPVAPAFLAHQSPPLAASPQFFSLSALGARFSPQPLLDSHAPAPAPFQSPFAYQPLWSPAASAQLDDLRGYRALLLERLKAVDSQLSQLGHIASLIGSGGGFGGGGAVATRGSRALSKSSIDSDVFSSGTSSRELELLEEETRIGQLRHSYEALRERLQTAAGEEAIVLRSVMAELEREMHALSSRQQVGLSLVAGDLQANQLALNRFVCALREEREQLMQQIEALTIAESRVSSMRTAAAATQLYLRYSHTNTTVLVLRAFRIALNLLFNWPSFNECSSCFMSGTPLQTTPCQSLLLRNQFTNEAFHISQATASRSVNYRVTRTSLPNAPLRWKQSSVHVTGILSLSISSET